jgi:hypothetical protein
MPRLQFRDKVAEILRDAFGNRTDCRIAYENGPLTDMDGSTLPVVSCEIVYTTSEQAELAALPLLRDEGSLLITVLVKGMSGSRQAYMLRDEAATLLQRKDIEGATTSVARMLPNSNLVKGWVGYRAAIPFSHYHR